jgi:putative MATE family efflux protein
MDAEDKGSANAGAKPSGKDVKPSGNGHRKTASNHVLDPTSYGSIWRLAWPVMVSMGAHTAFTIIDLYWIGALGTDALAAVSLIGNVLFCLFGFTQIVYVGALAMLSRRVGAGDLKGKDGAEGVAAQALQLSFLLGVGITILGVAAARPSVALFGTSETVAKLSVAYLIPMLVGFLPVYPLMALISFFTAGGDTRTPMQVGVAASLFNAALDPFLIFGWAGFPAWGVAGAGIASLVSAMLNLAALWVLYAVRELPFPRAHPFKWSGTRAYRTLFRIGIPASLGMLTRPASTVILLGVIAQFGTAGVAAFGVTVRALSLVWLYQGGLYTAVSTLTGRSLGAKNVGGIRALVRKSIWLSLAISMVVGVGYFAWPQQIIGIFERSNPEVLELGAVFIRLLVVANVATSFSVIWAAVLNGAGDTQPPMVIALVANWVIKLPLAYLMAVPWDMGVEGVWWAMFISLVFESGVTYIWYARDRWVHVKV